MELRVTLESKGRAVAGIDFESLLENLNAEVNKAAVGVDGNIERKDIPAPSGAQGAHALIEWIIHLAKEPSMAHVYVRAMVFGINEILNSVKNRAKDIESSQADEGEDRNLKARVKLLGKELILPTSTAVIKDFMDGLGTK